MYHTLGDREILEAWLKQRAEDEDEDEDEDGGFVED